MTPIFDQLVAELGNPRFMVMLPVSLAETLLVAGYDSGPLPWPRVPGAPWRELLAHDA